MEGEKSSHGIACIRKTPENVSSMTQIAFISISLRVSQKYWQHAMFAMHFYVYDHA